MLSELQLPIQSLRAAPVLHNGLYPGEKYTLDTIQRAPNKPEREPLISLIFERTQNLFNDVNIDIRRAHYRLWNSIIDQYNHCPSVMERLLKVIHHQMSCVLGKRHSVSAANFSIQLQELDSMLKQIDRGLRDMYMIQITELQTFHQTHLLWRNHPLHSDFNSNSTLAAQNIVDDHLSHLGYGDDLKDYFHTCFSTVRSFNNIEPLIARTRIYRALIAFALPELFDVPAYCMRVLVYRHYDETAIVAFWHRWYDYCVEYMPLETQIESELMQFVLHQYWLAQNKSKYFLKKVWVLTVLRKQYALLFEYIGIACKSNSYNLYSLSWLDNASAMFIFFTTSIVNSFKEAANLLTHKTHGIVLVNELLLIMQRAISLVSNPQIDTDNISLETYVNTIMEMSQEHRQLLQFNVNSITIAFRKRTEFRTVLLHRNDYSILLDKLRDKKTEIESDCRHYLNDLNKGTIFIIFFLLQVLYCCRCCCFFLGLQRHRRRLTHVMFLAYQRSSFLPTQRRNVCRQVMHVMAESFLYPGHRFYITSEERFHLQRTAYGNAQAQIHSRMRQRQRLTKQQIHNDNDEQQSKRPRLQ